MPDPSPHYWLDATSQLRGVKYSIANATATYSGISASVYSEWAYDPVGNRETQTGNTGSTTYTVDDINQYTAVSGVSTMAYSPRGNLTQFGDWTYTYDAAGNLIRAHNTQSNVLAKYWRDADGHRAVKDVDGAKTVFFNLGTTQLEAYDVPSDMASSTIHEPGIDRPLAEVSSSGTLTFYHQDWLGNVAMLTNASGAKVQTYTYDVWGKPSGFDSVGAAITPGSFASRLLFTSREYDTETDLYHYRARAYSPSLGRFIQTDPIDFSAGDVNLFRYVANNPINFVDPMGLWTFGIGGQASVNLVGSLSVSVGVFVGRDPGSGKWSFGVLGTLAPGIGGPGDVGAGGFVELTDAPCVNSLKGPGIDLGMSGGQGITGGASYVAGINPKTLERSYNGINVDLGVGGGVPISGHARGSGTAGWDTGGGWR